MRRKHAKRGSRERKGHKKLGFKGLVDTVKKEYKHADKKARALIEKVQDERHVPKADAIDIIARGVAGKVRHEQEKKIMKAVGVPESVQGPLQKVYGVQKKANRIASGIITGGKHPEEKAGMSGHVHPWGVSWCAKCNALMLKY